MMILNKENESCLSNDIIPFENEYIAAHTFSWQDMTQPYFEKIIIRLSLIILLLLSHLSDLFT